MLGEAMDEAWRRAEFVYVDGNDGVARTTLAEYILAVAKKGERDPERLIRGACCSGSRCEVTPRLLRQ